MSTLGILVSPYSNISGATVNDTYSTLSFLELLMKLSNSLTNSSSLKYFHRGQGVIYTETDCMWGTTAAATATPLHTNPTTIRRKRRRETLNAFFNSGTTRRKMSFSSSPEPAPLRQQTRQLLDNAKQNIQQVSATHAAMLELLCSAVVPDILSAHDESQRSATETELSEVELMLYIILRTSIAAAPTWQKPSVIPRCWLSPSITRMVECSPALQRTMRWSCDLDPVVEAVLGVDAHKYSWFPLETQPIYELPDLLTHDTDILISAAGPHDLKPLKMAAAHGAFTYWRSCETEEVQRLFAKKRSGDTDRKSSDQSPQHPTRKEASAISPSSPLGTARVKSFFSVFTEEYPPNGFFCSLLFVVLHRGIVGQQDPYLFLRLEHGERKSLSLDSLLSPSRCSSPQYEDAFDYASTTTPIGISVSPEFIVATTGRHGSEKKNRDGSERTVNEKEKVETRNVLCARGVITMLQWACQGGTLFLRLHQLCHVSERPEWRAALGQYGKSAIEALRWILLSLQRLVADMSDRAGGPHCVSFSELLSAQQRLRYVEENIMALSDILFVHAGVDWEASAALRELSSATLLTSLYRRYAQRTANIRWRDRHLTPGKGVNVLFRELDVVADLFLAVLNPLHRMIGAWLCAGELRDPFDEFFIVNSHGTTASGFLVDSSAQRLPEFISLEAAEAILHAGISLRVLRIAARDVKLCSTKEQKRLRSSTEDIDAASARQEQVEDAVGINLLLCDFMESLLGYRSPSLFSPMPEVSLLLQNGALSFWRTFYGACNDLLLSAENMSKDNLEDNNPFLPNQIVGIVSLQSCEGYEEETIKSSCNDKQNVEERYFSGKTKSPATSFSRLSKSTTVWCGAVTRELAQSARASCHEEVTTKTRERVALRLEYEHRVLRCKAQRQLQQWKAQRLSLKLERAAAVSKTVDDLQELYAHVFANTKIKEQQEEEEEKMSEEIEMSEDDGRATPIGKFVTPLVLLPPHSPLDGAVLNDNEETPPAMSVTSFGRPTAPPPHRPSSCQGPGSSLLSFQSSHKSLFNSVKERQADVQVSEICVVADINDDEYLMERAGPHVTDTSSIDALFARYEAMERQLVEHDVSSEAYQEKCKRVAIKAFSGVDEDGCQPYEGDESISKLWWTDPTTDERALHSYKGITIPCVEAPDGTHMSPEQRTKSLLHCSSYYLSLGLYTASFLTHKALQVLFLAPYGTLYRLTQQLLDVCLMQSGPVADHLTGLWQHLTKAAIEENEFDVSAVITTLNRAFVEEWESCVLHGGDTLQVQLALTIPDDSEEQGDVYLTANEVEKDGGGSGPRFLDTAFRRRTQCSASQSVAEEDVVQESNGTNDGESGDVVPLPENPFDFISQLTIVHSTPNEGFWLLPKNAVVIYGDLFSTLLFWTSVTQLVTRVWHVGIKSGVAEVFFFCNVSRAVLNAVVQHMWFLIAGYAREYRHSLCIESDVFYSYHHLGRFTTDHAAFLEDCRFAAMLTPAFARARQQVYGMVRQLEEVERSLLLAAGENTANNDEDGGDDYAATQQQQQQQSAAPDIADNTTAVTIKKKKSIEGEKTSRVAKQAEEKVNSNDLDSGGGSYKKKLLSPPPLINALHRSKRKPQRPLNNKRQQTLTDVGKRLEARRRTVRDIVRRRLRSFVGLTEIFVEHLTALRDSMVVDEESTVFMQNNEVEERSTSSRNTMHTNAQAMALSSLIRTLEMTQIAVHDKL